MRSEQSHGLDTALYKTAYVASSLLSLPARANGGVFLRPFF